MDRKTRCILAWKVSANHGFRNTMISTTPGSREVVGLPPGTGSYCVVTNLVVFGFDPESKRMILLAIQPGVTIEQVLDSTNFQLLVADKVR